MQPRSRDLDKIWHTFKHISKMHVSNISETDKEKCIKGAWPISHNLCKMLHTLEYISNTSKAVDFKFGTWMRVGNMYNKKLSYCWETVRLESMPRIA